MPVTFAGQTLSINAWARLTGIPCSTIRRRLKILPVDLALSLPIDRRFSREPRPCPELLVDRHGRRFVRWSEGGRRQARYFGRGLSALAAYDAFCDAWRADLQQPAESTDPPRSSKFARRGAGNGVRFDAPLPSRPTSAAPGSEEKILAMIERAERGERLFHPDDST
jgi:hypothetical protein